MQPLFSDLSKIRKKCVEFILVCFLGLVLSLVFLWPILASGDKYGIQDWDHQLAFIEFSRLSIVKYH